MFTRRKARRERRQFNRAIRNLALRGTQRASQIRAYFRENVSPSYFEALR